MASNDEQAAGVRGQSTGDRRRFPQAAGAVPDAADDPGAIVDLYRNIAASLPHGAVFVVDRDLRYVLADGAGLLDAGFTPADFEGRLLTEAVPRELHEQYLHDYRAMLLGVPMTREHAVNGRDFVSHGVPLTDRDGGVGAALVVSYDITERKRDERRLQLFDAIGSLARDAADARSLEQGAGALVEACLGGVLCRFDVVPDGIEAYAGSVPGLGACGAEALAQLARGEALLIPGTGGAGSCVLAAHLADGRIAGITRVQSIHPRAWLDEECALVREAGDRVWCHLDRLRLMEALREADQQKNRFLAVLAHELRNPLAAVRNGLGVLKLARGAVPQERIVYLMEQQFAHMERLIEDVLDASYVCHGEMALRMQRLSLHDVVQSAVEGARAGAGAKGQALVLESNGERLMLDADPTRLAQAIGNVIANAVKYSAAPGTIRIELAARAGRAFITVADQGIGMSDETLQHLFVLFVRGPDGERGSLDAGGLGIGMWVTRQLVEAHGGSIHAFSEGLGKGSTFTIELPLAPDEA